jgi:hypothetical protein
MAGIAIALTAFASCREKAPTLPSPTPLVGEQHSHVPANDCADCHPVQFRQWQNSSKSKSLESAVFQEAYKLASQDLGGDAAKKQCLSCHGPAISGTRAVAHSIDCESCHKVASVIDDGGSFAFEYVHGAIITGAPSGMNQRHSYWPRKIFQEATFCAPCHSGAHANSTHSRSSYDVWAESLQAENDITCQKCHMESVSGLGANHAFVGGSNLVWLREAFEIRWRGRNNNRAMVEVLNVNTPHNIPGGALDMREIVFWSTQRDAAGTLLEQKEVLRVGSQFYDKDGRNVPFWRGNSRDGTTIEANRPRSFEVELVAGVKSLEISALYHRVSPRLAWLLPEAARLSPLRIVSMAFDPGSGEVTNQSKITYEDEPDDDW